MTGAARTPTPPPPAAPAGNGRPPKAGPSRRRPLSDVALRDLMEPGRRQFLLQLVTDALDRALDHLLVVAHRDADDADAAHALTVLVDVWEQMDTASERSDRAAARKGGAA